MIGIFEKAGAKLAGPENIFYRMPDGNLGSFNFQQTETMLRNGQIGPETIVFNAAISVEEELGGFEAKLKNTWMSRFLKTQSA